MRDISDAQKVLELHAVAANAFEEGVLAGLRHPLPDGGIQAEVRVAAKCWEDSVIRQILKKCGADISQCSALEPDAEGSDES